MASKATVIAVVNQKGGTAKTTTCENLGVGLAMEAFNNFVFFILIHLFFIFHYRVHYYH